jgi:hypothetical protein
MTPQTEARVLRQLQRQLEGGIPRIYRSPWSEVALWLVLVIAFMVLFQLGERIHPLALAIVSSFIGIAAGVFGFMRLVAKQWPVVQPHINRESVASRLQQLGP